MAGLNLFEFGEFTLDVSERKLSTGGDVSPLAPKAFDLLTILVRHAGRLLSKRELLEQVWPEAFVEEGILTVHVAALRKALGDSGQRGSCIETVSRSGYRFVATVRPPTDGISARPATSWSLAVLPPQSSSGAAASDQGAATSLALADSLIDRLGRIDGLVVRPTRAVRSFSGPDSDPRAVGRSLQVDAVLESRLVRKDDAVVVSLRLVRSRDGACIWKGAFEDRPGNVAAIPGAVAESLAADLGVSGHWTSPAVDAAPTNRATGPRGQGAEAFELFGRGQAFLLSGSRFEVPKALEAFRSATILDPSFAAAHAGLALAWCAQAELRLAPPPTAYAEARSAALRALAMDSASADAQAALGVVLFLGEWDWLGAERSLTRALELNPNHTQAHLLHGRLLDALGYLDEGLQAKLRALERDPVSPLVHVQIALSYLNQDRYDEAIAWANKALALDPRHLLAREFLASAYWKKGDYGRHMAESLKHAEIAGAPGEAIAELQQIYSRSGRAGVLSFALERLSAAPAGTADIQAAVLHGEAGNLDSAFRHLERAIESRDPCLVDLAVGPQWQSLRADPRFAQCLSKMGLSAH